MKYVLDKCAPASRLEGFNYVGAAQVYKLTDRVDGGGVT